jgi:hypothetical protein
MEIPGRSLSDDLFRLAERDPEPVNTCSCDPSEGADWREVRQGVWACQGCGSIYDAEPE